MASQKISSYHKAGLFGMFILIIGNSPGRGAYIDRLAFLFEFRLSLIK